MKARTFILTMVSLFILGHGSYALASQQPAMSLEELESLLETSSSKTVSANFESVPRGTAIKRYDIEIRGVARLPGLKMILFTSSHKIVAGMSGSPVYVDNKLVGALAYQVNNFNFSDYAWGGIAPFSLMMEEAEAGYQRIGMSTFSYDGMLFEPIALGSQPISESLIDKIENGYDGFGDIKLIKDKRFVISTSIDSDTGTKKLPLKAGMPIVVDLIEWKDLKKGETTTVSAMGTITYVGDDGRVFAFGHPFLNSRDVVYSFRTCEVIGTAFSESSSSKLSGRKSEILGAITLDSTYGVYGVASLDKLDRLHRFDLVFQSGGKLLNGFYIRIADSAWTPILARLAFSIIGEAHGAPQAYETSSTQLGVRVDLEGHDPIIWSELFTSEVVQFGPWVMRKSSFDVAIESFFSKIYQKLAVNRYGIRIIGVSIFANFIYGQNLSFKLAAYRFPDKVVWGEDLVFEIMLVSQDNSIAVAKRVPIAVDWSRVEKPVYTKSIPDTEKTYEKIIFGKLDIFTASFVTNVFDSETLQKLEPAYFLGPGDFLATLSRSLEITNQKLFIKLALKSQSGLFNGEDGEEILPEGLSENTSFDWYAMTGGLKERAKISGNEDYFFLYFALPPVPEGVVDQTIRKGLQFEIVLKE